MTRRSSIPSKGISSVSVTLPLHQPLHLQPAGKAPITCTQQSGQFSPANGNVSRSTNSLSVSREMIRDTGLISWSSVLLSDFSKECVLLDICHVQYPTQRDPSTRKALKDSLVKSKSHQTHSKRLSPTGAIGTKCLGGRKQT